MPRCGCGGRAMAPEDERLQQQLQAFLNTESWEAAEAWLRDTADLDPRFVDTLIDAADEARVQDSAEHAEILAQHALLAARERGTAGQAGHGFFLLGLATCRLG